MFVDRAARVRGRSGAWRVVGVALTAVSADSAGDQPAPHATPTVHMTARTRSRYRGRAEQPGDGVSPRPASFYSMPGFLRHPRLLSAFSALLPLWSMVFYQKLTFLSIISPSRWFLIHYCYYEKCCCF
jgi:hypothetical protein